MSFLTRLSAAGKAFRSGEYWQQVISGMGASSSGISVTTDSALTYSAVWAALVLTTDTMSTVPLQLFRRTTEGRDMLRDTQLYTVLHDQANRIETAQSFRETFQWNIEMRGLGLAEIVRNGRGIAELWNINPDECTDIKRTGSMLEFIINGKPYTQDKIFYCYGPGRDGLKPRGRITVAREAIGMGMAMQAYGGTYFKNGTNVGLIFMHQSKMGDVAYKRLKESLESKYTGSENAHKSMVLEEGMKVERSSMTNEDSQFLESRKFQVSDIARFFSVKSHMIGDLEKATFSNIEQQGIEAVTYCWRPRAVRIEQAINQQLIRSSEVYAEHNLNGLMQGDLKSQAEAWHILLQDGVFNADEVRGMLNMNNQPDGQGKVYFFPMNMQDKANPGKDDDDVGSVARAAIAAYGMRFSSEKYNAAAKRLLQLGIEPVRMRNALKYAAMQASGVQQVRWVSEKGCPVCGHLHGEVREIGQPFEGKIKHPPLADGCNCSIVDAELGV